MGRDSIDSWIRAQAQKSAQLMTGGISATHLKKERAAFSETVKPARGSVLASPVPASWDPEPDYFFHWPRDAAHVMHALSVLSERAQGAGERRQWNKHFADIVNFSAAAMKSSGDRPAAEFAKRAAKTPPGFRQYLRTPDELSAVQGDAVRGEPRLNPDGSISILKWAGPQYDGAAERANACIYHYNILKAQKVKPPAAINDLIRADLDFTIRYADRACIGLWEEDGEIDNHYYTAAAQLGAVTAGIQWAGEQGDSARADRCRSARDKMMTALDRHWVPGIGAYKSLRGRVVNDPEGALDTAVIMAANHARLAGLRHTPMDDRTQATLVRLEKLFAAQYPINAGRNGLAYGRYNGDKYFSGGAYFFCTLGAAEFYYRLAAQALSYGGVLKTTVNAEFRQRLGLHGTPAQQAQALIAQGDRIMQTVRDYTPVDGSLAEQFDKANGQPRSARHLTWSYASFITAAQARESAMEALARQPVPLPEVKPR
jgi:glucoamylase